MVPIPTIPLENAAQKAHSKKRKADLLDMLIIEDNAEMRAYITQCIETEQYNILEAANGEEGINLALENIPDIIISDIMMPKKDGFEVTQTLRQNIKTSHIPIVLLTAKTALESKLEGLKKGADAYLSKPFSPEELAIRVNKLIELRLLLQNRYHSGDLTPIKDEKVKQSVLVEDEFYSSVMDYIHENLDAKELNGEIIGKSFGMSRMQLHRKIKALTRQPVSDIIRNERLKKAIQLLQEQQLNVSEVAYQTGFNSPSHFSRIFKAKYGKSPSEYKTKFSNSKRKPIV